MKRRNARAELGTAVQRFWKLHESAMSPQGFGRMVGAMAYKLQHQKGLTPAAMQTGGDQPQALPRNTANLPGDPKKPSTPGAALENGSTLNPSSRGLALPNHPMIVLYRPEIPPNTGTIARLCAAFRMPLVLIGPMGFAVDEKAFRRAGLDYWPWVDLTYFADWNSFVSSSPGRRLVFVETTGSAAVGEFCFNSNDALVFGPETSGIPADVVAQPYATPSATLHIPMWQENVRSINLANAVAIVASHAVHRPAR
jgi:tRNA (cytidine/uridine-2'-O-)-methyltransferase